MIAVKARRILITIGKVLPFTLCFIVLISYCECVIAQLRQDYLVYDNGYTYNTPISFFIARYFEYDWLSVVVTLITSVATQTCYWNRLAVLYLGLHLWFKAYVSDIELEETTIGVLCTLNIIITATLVYKGLKRLT